MPDFRTNRGNILDNSQTGLDQVLTYTGETDNCIDRIIDWGTSLERVIAQDAANKLESRKQLVNNVELFSFFNETLTPLLKRSKWNRLRKRLGKTLSIEGKAAIVFETIGDEKVITLSNIIDFRQVGYKIVEYWGATEHIYTFNGINYALQEHFYKDAMTGKIIKAWEYNDDKAGYVVVDRVEVPYPEIPVYVFINNEDELSDIDNVFMANTIAALNEISNLIVSEAQVTKTSFVRNKAAGSSQKIQDLVKEMTKHRAMEGTDWDNQLQAIMGVNISGSQSNIILQAIVNFIEDKILNYTFSFRDSTGTGTNKHNSEIATFNSKAIEYLMDKKEIREEDYLHFYKLALRLTEQSTEDFTVQVQLSKSVEILLDSADTIKQIETQGNIQAKIAERNSNENNNKESE